MHQDDIRVVTSEEGIRLEGAVSTIAAKRRAWQVAVQVAGGEAVHDSLQLRPDEEVGDDHLCDAGSGIAFRS
ncbi:BON domain-containing protein [Thioalkalivibrio sp.]|uniref:BON domain-containing protein n=1 Tax=Thioalkalivibrio sp. TaxID=2093813 RepID=UPI003561E054